MSLPITRSFAPSVYKSKKSDVLKPVLLREAIGQFTGVVAVVEKIRIKNNENPIFVSGSKFCGPTIPKSAQLLLAAIFIKYHPGDMKKCCGSV